jgi:Tol biopolymer transport system component
LARGAIPLDEASHIAHQIADALEAAHEQGVIHRDLKPANVRLIADGKAKVLDFGLAKSVGGETTQSPDPSLSPTVTSDRTRDGVILGTAAYMSPEQARGRPVDRRSDVWAFGCLLYEALTARKAFPGETISDTLAAVLKSDPDWAALPDATPEPVRRLLRRCLAKDSKHRLSSLGDARLDLEDATNVPEVPPAPSRSTARWLPWLVLPVVAGLVVVALAIVFAGRRAPSPEGAISYKRLTHQRGWVRQARIAPDGQTVIYSAAWEGQPLQLFLRRLDSTDALPVALEPAHARVLSVSSRGEIAVLLPAEPDTLLLPSFTSGTLARMPLTGGTPRAVAENVRDADWDPAGEHFALIRGVDGGVQLEYPAGEVLHRTTGGVNCLRVSPSGDLVAFFDHPYVNNNRGTVAIVSRGGEMQTLSVELESLTGLAWSPDGSEIWFSGADEVGDALFAVSLSGQLRVLRRSPDDLRLHDTTADGRVLVATMLFRLGLSARAPGETTERDLSWIGMSFVTDLSADGKQILFVEQHKMDYDVWLRRTDGSAPTYLGPGMSFGLSPDGEWALASLPSLSAPLTLLPTGAGTPLELPGKTGVLWATWTPDGERVVFAAAEPEREARLYVQGVDGGEPRAISDEGIQTGLDRPFRVSPDGRWVAALGPDRAIKLYPVEGGEPRDVSGALSGDEPSAWSEDSRGLFVSRSDSLPAQVFRLDLESGARSLWRELMPRDPAGIGGVYAFVLTPDGAGYAYTYIRKLDSLYVMTGLE